MSFPNRRKISPPSPTDLRVHLAGQGTGVYVKLGYIHALPGILASALQATGHSAVIRCNLAHSSLSAHIPRLNHTDALDEKEPHRPGYPR